MNLLSVPALRFQIRIIRCVQTPGTLTDTQTRWQACFFHVSFAILFVPWSDRAPGQRSNPRAPQKEKKKSPLFWLTKHEHPAGPEHAFLRRPQQSSYFFFPLLTKSGAALSDSSRWPDESYANLARLRCRISASVHIMFFLTLAKRRCSAGLEERKDIASGNVFQVHKVDDF